MAKQPTITDLNTLADVISPINDNFDNIQSSFDNTLSRDGSTPNQMEADIDLNGNDLLNVDEADISNLRIGGVNVTPTTIAETKLAIAKEYATVALLLASTDTFTVGQYVRALDGGFLYKAVTSGGDVTNADGQGFEILPDSKGVVFFEQWGAVGDWDGSSGNDDTAAVHAAFASSFSAIYGKAGKSYLSDPVSTISSTIQEMGCDGICKFYTKVDAASDIGIDFPGRQFLTIDGFHFYSTGATNDGLDTVGVKSTSCAILRVGQRVRFFGYSGKALQIVQCVDALIDKPVINGGPDQGIGISLEPSGIVPCTTVVINQPYILGCTNGIRSSGTVFLTVRDPIMELSGSSVDQEGAIHLIATSGRLEGLYFESCGRDLVRIDSPMLQIGDRYSIGAVAADVLSWVATAFDARASGKIGYAEINIQRLRADVDTGADLEVGENIIVPVAGGSTQFEKMTRNSGSGSLSAASTWEAISVLDGISAVAETRKRYKYTVRLGSGLDTQGFDSGTIYQGGGFPGAIVVVSDSGTVPTWLRMNGPNFELNSPSASALDYAFEFEVVSIG